MAKLNKEAKKYSITSGTFITVLMRWTDRLIGLVSTFILARLLMPEDFGVIAMASIVIEFVTVLLNLGVNVALIQNNQVTQEHYNSAWTLRLLQAIVISEVLIVLSPLAAEYFKDLRVELVIQVLAFSLIISGLENIGIVSFQKKMQFGAEFRFLFFKRIAGFIVTVALAFMWESYWALVVGTLVSRLLGVALSYIVHPMRPWISFKKMKEILSVSQWMVLNSIGLYLNNNMHKLIIGRWFSSATMGEYNLADEISAMPTGEILAPLNRVLFPAFANVKDDLYKLKELFLLSQSVQVLVAIPAAVGLVLVSKEAVLVLLGEKWLGIVPFIQILALVSVTQAIGTSSSYILLVMGKYKSRVLNCWFMVLVFIAIAAAMLNTGFNSLDVAYLRLLVSIIGTISIFMLVTRAFTIVALWELVRPILRPAIGVTLMSFVVIYVPFYLPGYEALLVWELLLVKILLGGVTYLLVILFLWWGLGCPNGAERFLLKKVGILVK
jgi:O-antigen/teichoic acid export membrane protein